MQAISFELWTLDEMPKHRPYHTRYAEYLLFLLNADPRTYEGRSSDDDWQWYREEAVALSQRRRRELRGKSDDRSAVQDREESIACATLPSTFGEDCNSNRATLDKDGLGTLKHRADFHEYLHELEVAGQLHKLVCCPQCRFFFYASDGRQRSCSSAVRRKVTSKPQKRSAEFYRRYRRMKAAKNRNRRKVAKIQS